MKIIKKPSLRSPVLIAGFSGWPNAGEVSTGSTAYLISKLEAEKFAEIEAEDYIDLTSVRPIIYIEDGIIKDIKAASNEFFYHVNSGGDRDIIIFQGAEPNSKWGTFADMFLKLAQEMGVTHIYTIGGLFDHVTHTMKPKVSAVVSDQSIMETLVKYDIEAVNYIGPCSIHSVILWKANQLKIPSTSLWGHVPHYVQVKNDDVCYAVLSRICRLISLDMEFADLVFAANNLRKRLNETVAKNPELSEYIKRIKEANMQKKANTQQLLKELKEKKVIKLDDFMRQSRESGDGNGKDEK